MTSLTKRTRLAMIGIDAADLAFIHGHRTHLPAFRRILSSPLLQEFPSTAKWLSGSVWPTFYTGKLPGEHGIYHHLQWDPQTMRLRRVAADWLYAEPFWMELERKGIRTVIVDVPMTMPRPFSGIEVTNWGSHDQLGLFHVHPPDLGRELRRNFGKHHPMGWEIPVRKARKELLSIRDRLIEGAQKKFKLCRWLARTREWDFLLAVLGETHRGGHILFPEEGESPIPENALLDVYRAVDRALDSLFKSFDLDRTALFFFALHGMERNRSQEHFLPPVMDRINARFFGAAEGEAKPEASQQRSLTRFLRENVSPGLQNWVARHVPVQVRDHVVSRAVTGGRNWPRTPGFPLLADLQGYIRWNIKGREAQGILEKGSPACMLYTSLLRQCLESLRIAGTDVFLVEDVKCGREFFHGRRLDYLPDFIVTWRETRQAEEIDSPILGRLRVPPATGRSGNHRPMGFFSAFLPTGHLWRPRRLAGIDDLAKEVKVFFEGDKRG
ncbi:MAG: alkaline phosphatase family protein [Acidobacteria bacterium]|nr:alkaline phosphatase family protein [Acidobacteriota bacterium]